MISEHALGLSGPPVGSDEECQQFCAELPSSRAAADFLDGRPGGAFSVVTSTLMRGLLVGTGIYVAQGKKRDLLSAYKLGAAGAIAIEAFVLGYTWWRKQK